MSFTVLKYRKNSESGMAVQSILQKKIQHSHILKKPVFVRQSGDGSSGFVINKIPAIIKPAVKRSAVTSTENFTKTTKYSTTAATGSGASFQLTGASKVNALPNQQQRRTIGAALSALPPNTIIKSSLGGSTTSYVRAANNRVSLPSSSTTASSQNASDTQAHPKPSTIYIRRGFSKMSARYFTMELIESNPKLHIGVEATRMPILKNLICPTANISIAYFYMTMKKLRHNEDLSVLASYFELSEKEAKSVFTHTLVKLSRYLRGFLYWPENARSNDNLKKMPFEFRHNLAHVQSLLETVDTEMLLRSPNLDCHSYKYILSITPNGIINYISEAYLGKLDDVALFAASNFKSCIPPHLTLMVDPGKAIPIQNTNAAESEELKSKPPKKKIKVETITCDTDSPNSKDSVTDSADESANEEDVDIDSADISLEHRSLSKYASVRIAGQLASDQTLRVVDGELKSRKVKDFSIPKHERLRASDSNLCRDTMRRTINSIREFSILKPCAIREPMLYQYLNEILIVAAAITNFNR